MILEMLTKIYKLHYTGSIQLKLSLRVLFLKEKCSMCVI